MSEYKEIVTKTIIGKFKKSFSNEYVIETEQTPNTVLGCWIINHNFHGTNLNDKVLVSGSYDVNVWYSYDNDSKTGVSTKTISYEDAISYRVNGSYDKDNEVIVRSLKQPTVSDVKVENGSVKLNIEKELGAEIIGNTKIKVPYESYEDDYDEIEEKEEVESKIDEVNEEYIN